MSRNERSDTRWRSYSALRQSKCAFFQSDADGNDKESFIACKAMKRALCLCCILENDARSWFVVGKESRGTDA
jgi:hypothetical protein